MSTRALRALCSCSPFLRVGLFRLGFAVYLVEAVCDVTLSLLFNVLLRPVHRDLALLAAFFGLVSTALFGTAVLFYFTALLILRGDSYLNTFSSAQLNALAMLSLKVYGYGAEIFMALYGVASAIRGYLIVRFGYLPKALGLLLGLLLMLAGLGFIAQNVAIVLAPHVASNAFVLPMFVAGVALTAWLLVKGVDLSLWEARASAPS